MAAEIDIPEGVVEAAARVVARIAGEDFNSIGDFARGVLMDTQRQCLHAALAEMLEPVGCVNPFDA